MLLICIRKSNIDWIEMFLYLYIEIENNIDNKIIELKSENNFDFNK